VRGLESGGQVAGDPASVGDLDALRPRPFPDLLGVGGGAGGCGPAAATRRRAGPDPSAGFEVAGEHLAQRLGVAGAQVDGVAAAVQAEPDGPVI